MPGMHEMHRDTQICPNCQHAVTPAEGNPGEFQRCPSCQAFVVFDARRKQVTVPQADLQILLRLSGYSTVHENPDSPAGRLTRAAFNDNDNDEEG